MVTIITPIFNRATLLPGVYESLCKQTCKDFEWIIVDDGSEDDVGDVVNDFKCGDFSIFFFAKKNGGKHTAINFGVQKSKGELLLILDSDDELPSYAIEKICKAYEKIRRKKDIGGVCGYMAHRDGKIIGQPLIEGKMDSLELRFKHHVRGDMAEIFRKDVLEEFPFPEFPGEKFCPEMLVWNRIAQKYKLSVFAEVIYIRDYLEGGLTDNIVRIRMQSPVASMMTYSEMLDYSIPVTEKMKAAVNYFRFKACLTAEHVREVNAAIPTVSFAWYWARPLGLLMHLRDTKRNK